MAVIDSVKIIAPSLCDVFNDLEIQKAINITEARVAGLDCNQELAHGYLVAHVLSLAQRDGEAGSVGAKKEGDLQINFSPGLIKSSFDQTSYGREFQQMVKECIIPMWVTC